jgi:uncharacterized protein
MTTPAATFLTPTEEELEDFIYFTRTADLPSLQSLITSLCSPSAHNCAPRTLLASAIDVDSDGQGSLSCLLHYPAANGNLEIITYLLSLLTLSTSSGDSPGAKTNDFSAAELVNHKNRAGNTPLHWAAMNGHLEVVKALVEAGGDVTVRNEAGRDAVVEAEIAGENGKTGCKEVVTWILGNVEGLERGIGGGEKADEEGIIGEEKVNGGGSSEQGWKSVGDEPVS